MKKTAEMRDELIDLHGIRDDYNTAARFALFAMQQPENVASNKVSEVLLNGLITAIMQPYDEAYTFKLIHLVRNAAVDIANLVKLTDEEVMNRISVWQPDSSLKVQIFDIEVLIDEWDVANEICSTGENLSGLH
ncbi:MAG: hypothetical protein H6Q66_1439 [Firmicutes bacterium]|nr:hypothetical protein [Bacillota bacterium]